MDPLPFSQACENNKHPILEHLRSVLENAPSILEIGSGTGQHGEFFASQLPQVHWQCTDVNANLESLNRRLNQAALDNLPPALALDVDHHPWACGRYDVVFTANSFHIMSTESVAAFFRQLPNHLNDRAQLVVYGPFRYGGEYTTESNARFDRWLKDRDRRSGIRDLEWVNRLAQGGGLNLVADHAMPANNQLVVWQRKGC